MADFGYREVEDDAKADMVHQVFARVAPSYDVMNDAMSGGLHRRWKDNMVEKLRPFASMRHLDVAGGTGDVAFRVLRQMLAQERKLGVGVERRGTVTACDINQNMLDVGMERARQQGLDGSNLNFVRGDAEELPFEDESMDAYTIAFGLRNVTRKDRALSEAHRVLRRGGRFLCLEFSRVENPLLARLYDVYSFRIIPEMGRAIAGDRESYQYLVESIRRFPAQQELSHMVREAGFKHVQCENVMSGVVAYHSAFKL
uniref:2-methoxy-6-polyprenyl-1,4-benzoquinol methylase, mitochondrial n=1 Tax=Picocystis salinarum TaxID=88271 RepID=A0A6U9Q2L1_9CHLO